MRCWVQKQFLSWCILCKSNHKWILFTQQKTFLTGSEYLLCVRQNTLLGSLRESQCWYEEEIHSRLAWLSKVNISLHFGTYLMQCSALKLCEALEHNSHTWNDKLILMCMNFFIKQMLFGTKWYYRTQNLVMDHNLKIHNAKHCSSIKILVMAHTGKWRGTKHCSSTKNLVLPAYHSSKQQM